MAHACSAHDGSQISLCLWLKPDPLGRARKGSEMLQIQARMNGIYQISKGVLCLFMPLASCTLKISTFS